MSRGALLLAALLSSCVAQESYHEPSDGSGGSAGKGSGGAAVSGKGGLDLLMPSQAGAGAGSSGTASVPGGECVTSAECTKAFPYCQETTGRCVECLSQRNCSGTGRTYCDSRTSSCVSCLNDSQCTHARPYCAPSLGQCVECTSTENCGEAGLVCDRQSFLCVPTCSSHADCAASVGTPWCDPQSSLCVACLADDECALATPRCSPKSRTCLQCLSDSDCQPGVPCLVGACADPK